ncbi:hypothetical protein BGZ94_001375 [Podila epigama]|nr:hypothetical protein BGZ94_001375 [Podila epigama]
MSNTVLGSSALHASLQSLAAAAAAATAAPSQYQNQHPLQLQFQLHLQQQQQQQLQLQQQQQQQQQHMSGLTGGLLGLGPPSLQSSNTSLNPGSIISKSSTVNKKTLNLGLHSGAASGNLVTLQ